MREIEMLTSQDMYTRELTKATLQTNQVPIDLPEELAEIPKSAAKARIKCTKKRLG